MPLEWWPAKQSIWYPALLSYDIMGVWWLLSNIGWSVNLRAEAEKAFYSTYILTQEEEKIKMFLGVYFRLVVCLRRLKKYFILPFFQNTRNMFTLSFKDKHIALLSFILVCHRQTTSLQDAWALRRLFLRSANIPYLEDWLICTPLPQEAEGRENPSSSRYQATLRRARGLLTQPTCPCLFVLYHWIQWKC